MAFVSNFSGEKVSFNLFQVIFHINFLLIGSDINNLCFKFWNFTTKFFYLLGFTKECLARQLLLLDLTCFCVFLDRSRFFKEPAVIACYAFEALAEVAFY